MCPVFHTHIHGNLEIEVEIDEEGDFMDAKCGDVWLELDANEIEIIMSKNAQVIHDKLDEYRRNRDDYWRSCNEDMRKEK